MVQEVEQEVDNIITGSIMVAAVAKVRQKHWCQRNDQVQTNQGGMVTEQSGEAKQRCSSKHGTGGEQDMSEMGEQCCSGHRARQAAAWMSDFKTVAVLALMDTLVYGFLLVDEHELRAKGMGWMVKELEARAGECAWNRCQRDDWWWW
jgi:hypothetical protein